MDTHDRSYYEPYDEISNPNGYQDSDESSLREHLLLKAAIDWVDDNNMFDLSLNLDSNNDGYLDSVTFMVSGEDTGWNELLWPHKWAVYTFDELGYADEDFPQINGVYLWDYTLELLGDDTEYDKKVGVGVLAHEMFHLLSAPDLYHYYDYNWIEAIGSYGLMETVGEVPSHMLGYMKMQYGTWIDFVEEITESGFYTLSPLQESPNNLYRISLGYSNEYIYLEYRDNEGLYESTLPREGLLIYRVDEDFVYYGNENGYYQYGEAVEEVWIFRPEMDDIIFPIEFDTEDPLYDVDGDIDGAIIHEHNDYNEAGRDTDILLFDSAGNEIELLITDLKAHNGYISFYVYFPTTIEPEIILNGEEEVIVEFGDTYIDPGYTVTDPLYEDSVTVFGVILLDVLGESTLIYELRDDLGNIVDSTSRIITVIDTTPPTAELLAGVDTITIGDAWVDALVSVSDIQDVGPSIAVTHEIDNQVVGVYEVTYTVEDNSGNNTSIIRYVNVVAEPTITQVDFVCTTQQTTFKVNEEILLPNCTYLNWDLTVINSDKINNHIPGTYEVLVQYEKEGTIFEFRTYIFVIAEYETQSIAMLPEEERKLL